MTQPRGNGHWQFIWAGLSRQRQTGGIYPSQRFLVRKMISPVPEQYGGQVIELGAGTGAVTVRLLARCPKARVLAWEINPVLLREAERNVAAAGFTGRVEFVNASALELRGEVRRRGLEAPDFVVSGVPLANLGSENSTSLIDDVHAVLGEGGMYVQFQHSTTHKRRISERFRSLRTVPVLLNLPPAVVYYASK